MTTTITTDWEREITVDHRQAQRSVRVVLSILDTVDGDLIRAALTPEQAHALADALDPGRRASGVTRVDVDRTLINVTSNAMNYPTPSQMLGKDSGPLRRKLVDVVCDLFGIEAEQAVDPVEAEPRIDWRQVHDTIQVLRSQGESWAEVGKQVEFIWGLDRVEDQKPEQAAEWAHTLAEARLLAPAPLREGVEEAYQRGHEDGYWNGKTTDMSPAQAAAFMAPHRSRCPGCVGRAEGDGSADQ